MYPDFNLSEFHREVSKEKVKLGSSLCMKCAHIVPSPRRGTGCEWSVNDKPVPGWTAVQCEFRIAPNNVQVSYCVKDCPKFIPYRQIYTKDT